MASNSSNSSGSIPLIELTSTQCVWLLNSIGCKHFDHIFSNKSITGEDLSYVQVEEDLSELGVTIPKIQLRKVFHRIVAWREKGVPLDILTAASTASTAAAAQTPREGMAVPIYVRTPSVDCMALREIDLTTSSNFIDMTGISSNTVSVSTSPRPVSSSVSSSSSLPSMLPPMQQLPREVAPSVAPPVSLIPPPSPMITHYMYTPNHAAANAANVLSLYNPAAMSSTPMPAYFSKDMYTIGINHQSQQIHQLQQHPSLLGYSYPNMAPPHLMMPSMPYDLSTRVQTTTASALNTAPPVANSLATRSNDTVDKLDVVVKQEKDVNKSSTIDLVDICVKEEVIVEPPPPPVPDEMEEAAIPPAIASNPVVEEKNYEEELANNAIQQWQLKDMVAFFKFLSSQNMLTDTSEKILDEIASRQKNESHIHENIAQVCAMIKLIFPLLQQYKINQDVTTSLLSSLHSCVDYHHRRHTLQLLQQKQQQAKTGSKKVIHGKSRSPALSRTTSSSSSSGSNAMVEAESRPSTESDNPTSTSSTSTSTSTSDNLATLISHFAHQEVILFDISEIHRDSVIIQEYCWKMLSITGIQICHLYRLLTLIQAQYKQESNLYYAMKCLQHLPWFKDESTTSEDTMLLRALLLEQHFMKIMSEILDQKPKNIMLQEECSKVLYLACCLHVDLVKVYGQYDGCKITHQVLAQVPLSSKLTLANLLKVMIELAKCPEYKVILASNSCLLHIYEVLRFSMKDADLTLVIITMLYQLSKHSESLIKDQIAKTNNGSKMLTDCLLLYVEDMTMAELITRLLLSIVGSDEAKDQVVQNKGIQSLISILRNFPKHEDIVLHCTHILSALLKVKDYAVFIVQNDGLSMLLQVLSTFVDHLKIVKCILHIVWTIFADRNLCFPSSTTRRGRGNNEEVEVEGQVTTEERKQVLQECLLVFKLHYKQLPIQKYILSLLRCLVNEDICIEEIGQCGYCMTLVDSLIYYDVQKNEQVVRSLLDVIRGLLVNQYQQNQQLFLQNQLLATLRQVMEEYKSNVDMFACIGHVLYPLIQCNEGKEQMASLGYCRALVNGIVMHYREARVINITCKVLKVLVLFGHEVDIFQATGCNGMIQTIIKEHRDNRMVVEEATALLNNVEQRLDQITNASTTSEFSHTSTSGLIPGGHQPGDGQQATASSSSIGISHIVNRLQKSRANHLPQKGIATERLERRTSSSDEMVESRKKLKYSENEEFEG